MDSAVVIESGAPLPRAWIDKPDVLVISQLEGESYTHFARRLQQRLVHYAKKHLLREVRYYAAPKDDSSRLRRFRLIALRALLKPLRRSAELHLFIPAVSGAAQFSLFRMVDVLRGFAERARVNIRLTFLHGAAWSVLPAIG